MRDSWEEASSWYDKIVGEVDSEDLDKAFALHEEQSHCEKKAAEDAKEA